MAYYIRQVPGIPPQIWRIDDAVAVRLGVTNPEGGPGSYFKADPEPLPLLGNGQVPTPPQLLLGFPEFRQHAIASGFPLEEKFAPA